MRGFPLLSWCLKLSSREVNSLALGWLQSYGLNHCALLPLTAGKYEASPGRKESQEIEERALVAGLVPDQLCLWPVSPLDFLIPRVNKFSRVPVACNWKDPDKEENITERAGASEKHHRTGYTLSTCIYWLQREIKLFVFKLYNHLGFQLTK